MLGGGAISEIETVTGDEKLPSLFKKISNGINNIRYILKLLGTVDLSTAKSLVGGDGTVTSTINQLSSLADSLIGRVMLDTKDYIVERGTSGIWTYKKYNSGIVELWARCVNINAAKDDNQSVSATNVIELPFIVSERNCHVSGFGNAWKLGRIYYNDNASNDTQMAIICYLDYVVTTAGTATATDQYINIYVTGKWK